MESRVGALAKIFSKDSKNDGYSELLFSAVRTCFPNPKVQGSSPFAPPGLNSNALAENRVAIDEPMPAQPEKETWVHPHAGSPPTEGTIEVWSYVDRLAIKSWGLRGLISGC